MEDVIHVYTYLFVKYTKQISIIYGPAAEITLCM